VAGFAPGIGPWHVIYDRFSRGNERELWAKVLSVLQKEKGAAGAEVIIDSTTMKVHRYRGGQKGGQQSKGTSRAGITTKFHAAITGDGRLVEGFLGGGQTADVTAAARLARDIAGCTVIADMGYNSDAFRRKLRGGTITFLSFRDGKTGKKKLSAINRYIRNAGL
jgi:transposase